MRIHVFDVEHGECSAIETPSGHLILIGLGHNSSTGWRPSTWARQRNQRPACAVLTNLDRDHVSDIAGFESSLRPLSIMSNAHVSSAWVRALKIAECGKVDPAVETALHWKESVYIGGPFTLPYGMEISYFCNSPSQFQNARDRNTNNLSVVTFVSYGSCGVLFPGDLETAGWEALLQNPSFLFCLMRANLLIASHHGRRGGYCADIFRFCKPHAVIISDKAIVHDTQDHDLYGKHCSGLIFGSDIRSVLTTRCDGKITIDVPAVGNYTVHIQTEYQQPWLRTLAAG